MDREALAKAYFDWLYNQVYSVADVDSPYSYTVLCFHMDQMEFIPSIPNDDNRAEDAIQLRWDFREDLVARRLLARFYASEWDNLIGSVPSIFEVLVALARRASFEDNRPPAEWFSEFVANLKLGGYSDEAYELQDQSRIKRVLCAFNERKYDMHGRGGIFPLRRPEEDQRKVELWYQKAAYMIENNLC